MEAYNTFRCYFSKDYSCLHSPNDLLDWLQGVGGISILLTGGLTLLSYLGTLVITWSDSVTNRLKQRHDLINAMELDMASTAESLAQAYDKNLKGDRWRDMEQKFADAQALQCDFIPFTVIPIPSFIMPQVKAEFKTLPPALSGNILEFFNTGELMEQCIRELRSDQFKELELNRKKSFTRQIFILAHAQIKVFGTLKPEITRQIDIEKGKIAFFYAIRLALFFALATIIIAPLAWMLLHAIGGLK